MGQQMRPEEEKWEWAGGANIDTGGPDGQAVFAESFVDEDWTKGERQDSRDRCVRRAQLAAQAPAMARVLLMLAHQGFCSVCGIQINHRPNCDLLRVLQDAGVLSRRERSNPFNIRAKAKP
jgi:hypothetical protein